MTAEPPDRSAGGGGIRQAHLLGALARHADVDLVVAGKVHDDEVRAAVRGLTELNAPAPPRQQSRAAQRVHGLWHLVIPSPAEEIRVTARTCAELATHIRGADAYDVVNIEHAGLAPLLPPERANRWVITLHNLGSEWAAQAGALAPGRRQSLWWERERRKSRRLEHWIVKSYDRTIIVSPGDAKRLSKPVTVIANGVDTARFHVAPLPPSPMIVFTGSLGYLPNVDGVVWFCNEILPLVRASIPDASVAIVGRNPVAAVRSLGRTEGVALEIDVADVLPALHAARVAIVPLRIGTGTRLKALEAMAAGRPVVGTTIGLEGLGIKAGKHALVADEPASFAAAVVDVLADDERARSLVTAGRQLVEANFDWGEVGAAYVDTLLHDLPPGVHT